jgi:hypothetical protein
VIPSPHGRRQLMSESLFLRPHAYAACCLPPGHDEQPACDMLGSREIGRLGRQSAAPGRTRVAGRGPTVARQIAARHDRKETP